MWSLISSQGEDRDKQHLIANVKQQLIDASVQFHAALRRHHSKTFADMYKVAISIQQCVQKSIKANGICGSVEMESILQHEVSPVPVFPCPWPNLEVT